MEKVKFKIIIEFIRNIKNFLKPISDLYFSGILKKDYYLNLKNGIIIKIRPKMKNKIGDIDIFNEIVIEDEYIIKKILKKGDVILDIGANIGIFSLQASSMIKNLRIYAFEPFKENFKVLKENVKLNKFNNIFPQMLAISDHNGKEFLFISFDNTGAHSIYNTGYMNRTIVKTETLTNALKRTKANFLKIDCEGAEYKILLSTSKKVIRNVDRIILEQHITTKTLKKYPKDSIMNYFKRCGFQAKILKKIFYDDEGEFWIIYAKRI
jgi:FkbM family methyltransferase